MKKCTSCNKLKEERQFYKHLETCRQCIVKSSIPKVNKITFERKDKFLKVNGKQVF